MGQYGRQPGNCSAWNSAIDTDLSLRRTFNVARKHNTRQLADLHGAMVDLMMFMARPQNDDALLKEAGVSLDRALFPLLVAIGRFGPIGVGDLADQVGRDYTTISRQVKKLAEQGLVESRPGPIDRRVTETTASDEGRRLLHAIHQARERLSETVFANWDDEDLSSLIRLMRRFVDDLNARV